MTWRELVALEMAKQKDDTLIMIEGDLDQEVSETFDCSCAEPVMAWSNNRVYFACEYDGLELIRSVPRRPQIMPNLKHLTLYMQ